LQFCVSNVIKKAYKSNFFLIFLITSFFASEV